MTYVVCDNCVDCKFTDCVDVCPVDCFYEAAENPNMLYIHPDECIDCGACVPECPVEAIFADHEIPDGQEHYLEINAEGATMDDAVCVSSKMDPLPTAEEKKEKLGL